MPLQPNHTHFIFCDDGQEGRRAWGCEHTPRTNLETHIHRLKKVSQVLLVRRRRRTRSPHARAPSPSEGVQPPCAPQLVQGGPDVLPGIVLAARNGTPIVILAESGGAAHALYSFCTDGIDAVCPSFHAHEKLLHEIDTINRLYELKLLKFFLIEEETRDISVMLLEGIIDMIGQCPVWDMLPVSRAHQAPVAQEARRWIDSVGHVGAFSESGSHVLRRTNVSRGSHHLAMRPSAGRDGC